MEQESRFSKTGVLEQIRQVGILAALVITCAVFAMLTPNFLTGSNIRNIFLQSSVNAIIAVGMTLVITTGGIDLSVGPLLALVGVITADLVVGGTAVPIAILVGLLVGVAGGLLNGVLIAKLKLQPFIVTLGTMSLYRGMALIYTNGDPIFGVSENFRVVFNGNFGPIPGPVFYLFLVAAAAGILLNFTRMGLYIKAMGGNEEATRLAGVNINLFKTCTYVVSGFLAAVASLVLVGRLGAAEPIAGSGYELDAIAAAAIGGTSMAGGKGTIFGTILGALLLGALRNGLTLMNVQAYYQTLASGAIILLAVIVDRLTRGSN